MTSQNETIDSVLTGEAEPSLVLPLIVIKPHTGPLGAQILWGKFESCRVTDLSNADLAEASIYQRSDSALNRELIRASRDAAWRELTHRRLAAKRRRAAHAPRKRFFGST